MMKQYFLGITLLFMVCLGYAHNNEDCEVCVKTLDEFGREYLKGDMSEEAIQEAFKKYCLTAKPTQKRLCYILGGSEISATSTLGQISGPLKSHVPPHVVCQRLRKHNPQICELRFEKEIDLTTVDLKKLKVRDLKKILNDWDEVCEGCIEKTDYIRRIEELKPKHAPAAKQEL